MAKLTAKQQTQPAGYYGKLPARADFVSRRLPRLTIAAWDSWLEASLAYSQMALGPAWQDLYLTAPAWRFALPARACGEAALIGVMTPSVDAVGRCFPLLLAQPCAEPAEPARLATGAAVWFEAAEPLALQALTDQCDLALLDRPLPMPVSHSGTPELRNDGRSIDNVWIPLPTSFALDAVLRDSPLVTPRAALWWTHGGHSFAPALAITVGLVTPAAFSALIDGAPMRHGWRAADGAAPADGDLAWDREG